MKLVKWTEHYHSDADRCHWCNGRFQSGELRLVGAAVGEGGELDTNHPFIIHRHCKYRWQREKGYAEAV